MKRRRQTAAPAAWCLLALTAALAAEEEKAPVQVDKPSREEWLVERQERTWQVETTASISVENHWGNVAVRAHQLPEVYLLANSQRHRDDPRALDLTVVNGAGELSVVVEFEEKNVVSGSDSWAKRRADVTVFVPETAVTRFSTGKGSLEIRGTRGPTEAQSTTGDVRLRVRGAVTAKTDHGNVLAQFLRTDWSRLVEITTLTGSIRVEMPRGGRAEVAIETRGEITSDYSMEVERVEGSRLKKARVLAGVGGRAMHLTSRQGSIQLVESLVPVETGGR